MEQRVLRHKAAYQTPQSRIYKDMDQYVLRHGAAYIKKESSLLSQLTPAFTRCNQLLICGAAPRSYGTDPTIPRLLVGVFYYY